MVPSQILLILTIPVHWVQQALFLLRQIYCFKLSGELWFNEVLVNQSWCIWFCESSNLFSVSVSKQLRTELISPLTHGMLPCLVFRLFCSTNGNDFSSHGLHISSELLKSFPPQCLLPLGSPRVTFKLGTHCTIHQKMAFLFQDMTLLLLNKDIWMVKLGLVPFACIRKWKCQLAGLQILIPGLCYLILSKNWPWPCVAVVT